MLLIIIMLLMSNASSPHPCRGSKFFKPGQAKKKSAADGMRMRCADCSTTLAGQAEAAAHAKATGHTKFEQVK